MMMRFASLIVAALWVATSVSAQENVPDTPAVKVQVLTINTERLYLESSLGRDIESAIQREENKLQAEYNAIIAELEREEQELTDLRATTSREAFTELANAFDAKVEKIRAEQTQRALVLQQDAQNRRQVFLREVQPIILALMTEMGASVVIEKGSVVMSLDQIDITQQAIDRISLLNTPEQPSKQ